MRSRPTRTISVGTTPVNIRKTPSPPGTGIADPNALPVTYSTLRYATGGGYIELVPASDSALGDGQKVDAGADFNDIDQSLYRYAISSTGTISLAVTDYEA